MADVTSFLSALGGLGNFGGLGILVAFLIWRDHCSQRDRLKMEQDHASEKKQMEDRRMSFDRERLDEDKRLTAVLATLTATIQARWNG